ncbi:hypothetical protein BDZ91DRAFT_849274 [Kalaharituber pfeilii]|nr:hypothetical protein BDZ91DRAFT_849274 [Kalaharituber pfeilii]
MRFARAQSVVFLPLITLLGHFPASSRAYHAKVGLIDPAEPLEPESVKLVPYPRSHGLPHRTQSYLGSGTMEEPSDLQLPAPGESVEVVYGEDLKSLGRSQKPMVSHLILTPPPNRALLVLENYMLRLGNKADGGDLLIGVECRNVFAGTGQPSIILDLGEAENSSKWNAFNDWLLDMVNPEGDQELVVVTNSDGMKGCGDDERTPYLVKEVKIQGVSTVLIVTPLEWKYVAAKIAVEFGCVEHHGMVTRDTLEMRADEDDWQHMINIDPPIPPRLQLYPVDVASVIDVGIDIPFVEPKPDGPMTVTCINCGIKGNLTFSGNFEFDMFPQPVMEQGYLEIEVTEDIVAHVELEFATEGKFVFEFEQSLFILIGRDQGFPLSRFVFGPLFITPYFDYSIGVSVEVGTPQGNVTTGIEMRLPKGAHAKWDFVGESTQSGWDLEVQTLPITVNQIPDTALFSLGVNVSSIPSLLLSIEFLGLDDISAGGKLGLLLPRMYTIASLLNDVLGGTSACKPAGPEDYEYYPYAVSVEHGYHLGIFGELYARAGFEPLNLSAGIEQDWTIFGKDFPVATACFLYEDSDTGVGKFRPVSEVTDESEMVLDWKKVEQKWRETGEIPSTVDLDKLAKIEELPDDFEAAIKQRNQTEKRINQTEQNGNGTDNDSDNGVSGIGPSLWTLAIAAIGAAFF